MPPLTDRQTKIDWLLAHQDLWEGWPRGENGNDPRQWTIVAAMKDAGLWWLCPPMCPMWRSPI